MKKVILPLVLIGIGGAAGVVVYRHWLKRERDALNGALRLYGTVDVRDAQLAFNGSERIERVLVEEGDRVAKDQLLATLRTERLQAEAAATQARIAAQEAAVQRLENGSRPEEIERAKAEVAAAQARADNDGREIERLKATAATGASSAQQLDDAQARQAVDAANLRAAQQTQALVVEGPRKEDVAQATAELESLRADWKLLQQKLSDCELHAPSAGVVESRILEPGEMASPERPVLLIALTDPKWIRAYAPEPELGRIKLGLKATVRSDAFGGRDYAGRIGFISPVAEFTPKSVQTEELRTQLVFEVRVLVDDPRDELRLGMPVTVDLDVDGTPAAAAGGAGGGR
jgi:HlyD family secretion protein